MQLHPIKEETFDVSSSINIDPKGFRRAVDRYVETDFGLYMARGANHPRFGYLESWLLPDLNLRANIFHDRPGLERDCDFYLDVAMITRDGVAMEREGAALTRDATVWRTRDLYLDITTRAGEPVTVLDVDELAAAIPAGYISPGEAELALNAAFTAVAGISAHGGDAMAWFSAIGYPLRWAPAVTLSPAD